MSEPYPVPLAETRNEIQVLNSRFIAALAPTFSVDEARAFINRIKQEFPDANHHVPAYLIGHGTSVIAHSSDDGEPSGTAGRPALAVLTGSGLGDVVVVVTRYFGGTKLGTGGLVRAYSDSVRLVTAKVKRGARIMTCTTLFELPYRLLEQARLRAAVHRGEILAEDFTSEVLVTARFPVDEFDAFRDELRNLSNGSIEAEVIETGKVIVPTNI